jgi:hypothetical protein
MDTDNLQYLQNNLKHLGFADKLNTALEQQLKTGAPEFTLRTSEYYTRPDSKKEDNSTKDKVDYELHFKQGKEGERYYFNSYNASLEKNGQVADHKFYIDKGNGMTRKEAYNLLDGRAVYKELKNKAGEEYKAWLKLDPEKKDAKKPYLSYSEGYGFDLVKALEKLPIKELKDEGAMQKIVAGLEKGNLVPVTYVKDGNDAKMVAMANPQFKSVELFGMDGRKLFVENAVKSENGQQVEEAAAKGVEVKVEHEEKKGRKR